MRAIDLTIALAERELNDYTANEKKKLHEDANKKKKRNAEKVDADTAVKIADAERLAAAAVADLQRQSDALRENAGAAEPLAGAEPETSVD